MMQGKPRAVRGTPSSRSTEPLSAPQGFVPMYLRDAIVSMRLAGTGHEVALPPARSFTIGTGRDADVRLPYDGARRVSRVHTRVHRRNEREDVWLEVVDNDSTNGTYFAGEKVSRLVVRAGQRFALAETELLVMDKVLVRTRAAIASYLGYEQHAVLDATVGVVEREALIVCGERGAERDRFALDVHQASRRGAAPCITVSDPTATRDALAGTITAAAGGTVVAALDGLRRGAPLQDFLGLVLDKERRTVPILIAKTAKDARDVLGPAATMFQRVEIPPLSRHRKDVPRILDELWTAMGKPYRQANVPADRLAAMSDYGWKSDRAELREVAIRLAAVLDHKGNVRAAAKALDQNYDWVRQSLLRCGAIRSTPRGDGYDDERT